MTKDRLQRFLGIPYQPRRASRRSTRQTNLLASRRFPLRHNFRVKLFQPLLLGIDLVEENVLLALTLLNQSKHLHHLADEGHLEG